MHEFVFLAALDMGEDALADRCLQPVLKRFPGSTRGQLLLGQWQEYKGQCTNMAADLKWVICSPMLLVV